MEDRLECASGEKPQATLVVTGIRTCLTMAAGGGGPAIGEVQEQVGDLLDAAIAVRGKDLIYVGPANRLPATIRVAPDAVRVDAGGGVVLPGFIDCHTHLIFAGWRTTEFVQRIAGASYQQILASGGGIHNTVERTRVASEEKLTKDCQGRLNRMLCSGTTTVEAKSGYGLTLADEAKILRVAGRLDGIGPWDVIPTLLGAHALPGEYSENRDGYVELVEEMIETLADRAVFVDAFCEIGAFTSRECHLIEGFQERGRIGTSLSAWGSKSTSQIDFGYLDIPHERGAFLRAKLTSPRSVDDGKIKMPQEKARMPNFGLTPAEIQAVATATLGYTDEVIPDIKKPAQTPRKVAMEAGRQIVNDYNCRACHIIEDRGGAIRAPIEALGIAAGQDRAVAAAYAPPNLNTEGAKTQPEWLYRFLNEPTEIRPWLNVRMPTFEFNGEQLNSLTAYFSALDDAAYPFDDKFTVAHEYPRTIVTAGRTLAQGQLQCFRCHVQDGVPPAGQAPDQWAPDLAMAAQRLRYEWIQDWIADPQSIFPGTKMPQYWQELDTPSFFTAPNGSPVLDGNTRQQIEALAAYIMSIGE